MRPALLAVLFLSTPLLVGAQESAPTGFAALEIARSKACVGNLARMADLNRTLEPLSLRFDRLRLVAQGVALEDPEILGSLDTSDPVERAVSEWFIADAELARRYVEEQEESLVAQRATARETITLLIREAGEAVQEEAREVMDAATDVREGAALCEGAILVRSAVLEACQGEGGPVCDAAASTQPGGAFQFVEAPNDLWDLEQIRPWSDPTTLQISPDGQLVGARSVSSARQGNVVIIAAVGPLLRDRNDLTPEQIQHFEQTLDSMGIAFEHPQLVFAPALDLRANLPEPLAGETAYVLHFGPITQADVIWTGPAATGEPLQASIMLSPAQVGRLRSGDAMSLAAMKGLESGQPEVVLAIEITPVNQAPVIGALLDYMAAQFSADLAALLPGGE